MEEDKFLRYIHKGFLSSNQIRRSLNNQMILVSKRESNFYKIIFSKYMKQNIK